MVRYSMDSLYNSRVQDSMGVVQLNELITTTWRRVGDSAMHDVCIANELQTSHAVAESDSASCNQPTVTR